MSDNVVTMPDVAPDPRTERFTLRIAPAELAMLDALAEERGLSAADIVRMLIRDAYRAKFGEKAPRRPKK